MISHIWINRFYDSILSTHLILFSWQRSEKTLKSAFSNCVPHPRLPSFLAFFVILFTTFLSFGNMVSNAVFCYIIFWFLMLSLKKHNIFISFQMFLSSPDLFACAANISNTSVDSLTPQNITTILNISLTSRTGMICGEDGPYSFFPQVCSKSFFFWRK